MTATSPDVTQHVILELIGPDGSAPVEAELRYDAQDPYAVAVVFFMSGSEVTWLFGRDLLMRGVSEPAGEGDVQVFPSLDTEGHVVIVLQLTSPHGQALVEAPAREVLDFLARTTVAVWPGTESDHLRLDEAIDAFLLDC